MPMGPYPAEAVAYDGYFYYSDRSHGFHRDYSGHFRHDAIAGYRHVQSPGVAPPAAGSLRRAVHCPYAPDVVGSGRFNVTYERRHDRRDTAVVLVIQPQSMAQFMNRDATEIR